VSNGVCLKATYRYLLAKRMEHNTESYYNVTQKTFGSLLPGTYDLID
jgi:hypothetical protein